MRMSSNWRVDQPVDSSEGLSTSIPGLLLVGTIW